ncbi:hypothetical protein C8J57DRAFT_1529782 [Mycena rebaudengoi]|nr:hypothetical protein C8J57DRAFT_1529782 [Mycena rebaudengoi]
MALNEVDDYNDIPALEELSDDKDEESEGWRLPAALSFSANDVSFLQLGTRVEAADMSRVVLTSLMGCRAGVMSTQRHDLFVATARRGGESAAGREGKKILWTSVMSLAAAHTGEGQNQSMPVDDGAHLEEVESMVSAPLPSDTALPDADARRDWDDPNMERALISARRRGQMDAESNLRANVLVEHECNIARNRNLLAQMSIKQLQEIAAAT